MIGPRTLVIVLGLAAAVVEARAGETSSQAVDRIMAAAWARDKVQPAGPADDSEFMRRVYLDLVGRIPARDELLAFCADARPDKKARLIDALLAGDEFPRHWRENLHVLLMGGPPFAGDPGWRAWLEESLRKNRPWDETARAILTAPSDKTEARAASVFLVSRLAQGETGLDLVTRDVSRFFFGVDIQCARCHKHPEVKQWKQESYWGMVAFFNRSYPLAVKGTTFLAERASGEVEFTPKGKEKKTAEPAFLTGDKLTEPKFITAAKVSTPSKSATPAKPAAGAQGATEDQAAYVVPPEAGKEKTRVPVPKFSRRAKLAEVAINPRNPYFKRAIVNYVWSQLLGRGLVEPIDQMHDANPGSHPELLNYLADDLAAHRFDLRHLIRTIANSRMYQLSSHAEASTPPPEASFAVALVRPMSPQQLANSLLVAAGYYDALKSAADPKKADAGALRAKMESQHAARLAFLVKNLTGGSEPSKAGVAEVLFQANNREFAAFLTAGGLASRLAGVKDEAAAARELFLTVLSRPPTPAEVDGAKKYLESRSSRRPAACEQLLWALTASSEFRFNH